MKKSLLFVSLILTAGTVFAQTPSSPAKVDLEKAKQTVTQVCAACHGADGNAPITVNPKLAQQHPEYLYKQLLDFKAWDGKPAARANPVMAGMTAALSKDDMRSLAVYFSEQTQTTSKAKNAQTIVQGQKIWRAGIAKVGIPACAGCHGPAGAGLPAQYPRIAGQNAQYTEAQLKAFRSGERANDAASMMRQLTARMTDAEIKAVADYAAGLRSR